MCVCFKAETVKPGMVAHIYNLSTWGWRRQEELKFETSLGYIARPVSTRKLWMIYVYIYHKKSLPS